MQILKQLSVFGKICVGTFNYFATAVQTKQVKHTTQSYQGLQGTKK